jgi:hypothetical protein
MPFVDETDKKKFKPHPVKSLRALLIHFERLTVAYCHRLRSSKARKQKTK